MKLFIFPDFSYEICIVCTFSVNRAEAKIPVQKNTFQRRIAAGMTNARRSEKIAYTVDACARPFHTSS